MKVSEINTSEYDPYFQGYIGQVGDKSLIESLTDGKSATVDFFSKLPEAKQTFRYAENKWTPKEILLHLIDAERMFCFRALSFARTANANLPGFDENEFAKNSMANARTMEDLLSEFTAVRQATVALFDSFSDEVLQREGMANRKVLSVRAAGFLICGHEIHHRKVIRERYLS